MPCCHSSVLDSRNLSLFCYISKHTAISLQHETGHTGGKSEVSGATATCCQDVGLEISKNINFPLQINTALAANTSLVIIIILSVAGQRAAGGREMFSGSRESCDTRCQRIFLYCQSIRSCLFGSASDKREGVHRHTQAAGEMCCCETSCEPQNVTFNLTPDRHNKCMLSFETCSCEDRLLILGIIAR